MDETSQPIEFLVSVDRDGDGTLGSQVEEQFRRAIRDGVLHPGARVPSTRDLARQLGVSRRIAVDAYAQLAAEGYLSLRQGARPHVADAPVTVSAEVAPAPAAPRIRFDFRPSVPDVSAFPRKAWLRSLRYAVDSITDADLGYGEPLGVEQLRAALAGYLGRVRGVVAEPARVVVTSGYMQGLGVVCHTLAASGAKRIAVEAPGDPEAAAVATRAGLEPVPIPVDEEGIDVALLEAARVDAVTLTPAHQHPTGVVLTAERRHRLVAWLRATGAVAIEDDYDAEYRYDRAAVGALQGLAPDHVVYGGTASKTLAPALRIGWLVVPPAMLEPIRHEKLLADRGTSRIEQLAFADFLERGEVDRHLRRMRLLYRERRDALVEALADQLPEATVRGIAAGLHATVELTPGDDEEAIVAEAAARHVNVETMREFGPAVDVPPTLMLGYGQMPEPTIRVAVAELADAINAARRA